MNLLITSVGRRSYMVNYFKSALKGKGLVHAGNSEMTFALQEADHYLLLPKIYDDTYIDTLTAYCLQHQINALISLFDIDLPVLAKNKSRFEAIGVRLLISDYAFTSICNDKWQTRSFLQENNLNTPLSYLSLESCLEALKNREISFPLMIKPRWGMGSIGVFQADNQEELVLLYRKEEKEIRNSYLKYESQADPDKCILIQEKLQGEEWGLDIFNDLEGNFLTCVPKQKLAMRAGETDIARVVPRTDLQDFGKYISTKTKHIGNLDVDFFIDKDTFTILEMNCRFGGQYPFAHAAGTNFPKVIIALLNGEKPDAEDLHFSAIQAFKDLVIRKI